MRSGDFSVGAAAQPYGYVYEIINTVNGETYVGVRIGLCSKRKLTPSGLTGIELHDQMVAVIAGFDPTTDSLRPLARMHSYTYTTLRQFSYGHGPTSRGAECLLCLARSSYPHLLKSDELIEAF